MTSLGKQIDQKKVENISQERQANITDEDKNFIVNEIKHAISDGKMENGLVLANYKQSLQEPFYHMIHNPMALEQLNYWLMNNHEVVLSSDKGIRVFSKRQLIKKRIFERLAETLFIIFVLLACSFPIHRHMPLLYWMGYVGLTLSSLLFAKLAKRIVPNISTKYLEDSES